MRILILSCKTGGGHNSCARAIEETFKAHGDFCETVDCLSFVSEGFSNVISKGHSTIYRYFPSLFRFGYSFAERHPSFLKKGSPVYRLIANGGKNLYNFIEKGNYDAIISVHVFGGIALAKAFEGKSKGNLIFGFVATDYTCSPGVGSFDYDYFFIPDESNLSEFIKKGIPSEKLVVSGIPVRKMFLGENKKAEDKHSENILLMCGSMGCGPIEKTAEELEKNLPNGVFVTAVCGNNRKLYKKLYTKYKSNSNIQVVGFTEEVPELLDSAKVCLTKPGGLSATETMTKGVPLVLINAVGGCEQYNMDFFIENGGAVTAKTSSELSEKCFDLLNDRQTLIKMSKALGEKAKPFASEKIFKTIRGHYENI